ncbi:sugar porter (SP) family MFS transporter [Penicillium atrosanguineum]|uniref:Sugar porter (SP) family MFS transporter n=1 Tax=Penicillium atrosanguineum TaxID=1132637 RepID=A0A9W9Q086_9EURO|nr:sugar porter (SP) family MFS transporter [Penicillium atrosanguineum]
MSPKSVDLKHVEDIDMPVSCWVSIDNTVDLIQSTNDVKDAVEAEHKMTLWQAIKMYPKAIAFSTTISFALVMEGYDTALVGGFFSLPQFRQRFGDRLPDGTYQVSSSWQSGLSNGAQVGEITGLVVAGIIAEKYGYRKTIIGSLFFMIGVVFLFFFAQNIGMLFAAEVLAGLPWGAFQTLTTTYAADVTPIQLRPILTSYVNMCWVIGQFVSSGVLRALLTRNDNWAWRIPYAIQWAFPIPIIIACIFAPESPYWLARKGRVDEARKALRSLASHRVPDEVVEKTLALVCYTNELEKQSQEGTSYSDCFKGVNLRRTEIAVMAWVSQVFSGIWFGGSVTYFMEQAGLTAESAFNMGLGNNAVALVATMVAWGTMTRVGRRTMYLIGLTTCFVILITVGFMGIPLLTSHVDLGWASGALLMCFVIAYDLTLGPICYCLVAEIPSTRLRMKTAIIARNCYNVASICANFLVRALDQRAVTIVVTNNAQNYPILNPSAWNLRGKGGFIWCGFCFISLVWAYFRLPEPKGLSPAELDVLFEKKVSARKFRVPQLEAL